MHLLYSPNFPRASHIDERTLTHEPIANWSLYGLGSINQGPTKKLSFEICRYWLYSQEISEIPLDYRTVRREFVVSGKASCSDSLYDCQAAGAGRPRAVIIEAQKRKPREEGFRWEDIARYFGVSVITLHACWWKFGWHFNFWWWIPSLTAQFTLPIKQVSIWYVELQEFVVFEYKGKEFVTPWQELIPLLRPSEIPGVLWEEPTTFPVWMLYGKR